MIGTGGHGFDRRLVDTTFFFLNYVRSLMQASRNHSSNLVITLVVVTKNTVFNTPNERFCLCYILNLNIKNVRPHTFLNFIRNFKSIIKNSHYLYFIFNDKKTL